MAKIPRYILGTTPLRECLYVYMAYIVMAYIVMAWIAMAWIAMASIVMAIKGVPTHMSVHMPCMDGVMIRFARFWFQSSEFL